jgi:hypothetical protein
MLSRLRDPVGKGEPSEDGKRPASGIARLCSVIQSLRESLPESGQNPIVKMVSYAALRIGIQQGLGWTVQHANVAIVIQDHQGDGGEIYRPQGLVKVHHGWLIRLSEWLKGRLRGDRGSGGY